MTHPSVPEPTVPLRPTGPAGTPWGASPAEPTLQLPALQQPPTEAPPAWVPRAEPVDRPPVPYPASYPAPYAPEAWDRPLPNPYEQAAPAVWTGRPDPRQLAYAQGLYAAQKSRVGAGVLGLLLGVFGVHNFYLGRSGVAVLQLLLTVLSLGLLAPLVWLWSTLEAILILVGSPSFAADRRGIPLR
jgi:hypothetical protein